MIDVEATKAALRSFRPAPSSARTYAHILAAAQFGLEVAEKGRRETAWRTDQDNTVVYTEHEGSYIVYSPIQEKEKE